MPKTVMMSGGATCPSQVSRRKIGSVRFVYSGNVTCQSFVIAWEDLPIIEKMTACWKVSGEEICFGTPSELYSRGEVCLHPSDGQIW